METLNLKVKNSLHDHSKGEKLAISSKGSKLFYSKSNVHRPVFYTYTQVSGNGGHPNLVEMGEDMVTSCMRVQAENCYYNSRFQK